MSHHFLIIGSGLAGSVLARELADQLNCQIEIWEEKDHLAGNCYTSEDEETGIMVHHYGPHIFNTDKKEIWDYFNRFSLLMPYIHHVRAIHNGVTYSFPINLSTINRFFNQSLTSKSAKELIDALGDHTIVHPANFEEQAIRFLGKDLYHAFFYGYTKKQWGCEPGLLPASVLKRIPVRFNNDDNYHLHPYTGIPVHGYTSFVEKLIDHPSIHLTKNRKFFPEMETTNFDHVFYTGPLDAYFHFEFGRLGYRTLQFETERHEGDFQEVPQVNYCDEVIPWTRITEHKHLAPWQHFDRTIISKEYSKESGNNDIPFYPKRLEADKALLAMYRTKAKGLQGISFLGRLGTYRYLDMQHVIGESIEFAKTVGSMIREHKNFPVFPNEEEFQNREL